MPDYSNYKTNITMLGQAQDAEEDNRNLSRGDHIFVTKEDGMWETPIFNKFDGKPRYTFDQTTPIIDQIAGDIEKSNFDITIKPTGAGATKELADLRAGMTRNIENISGAQGIYSMAGRNMVISGIDHWMVATEFLDETSFDQDLVIKPIHNSIDRVWFDLGAQEQDKSDSNHGWLLSAVPIDEFREKNPDRSGRSVDDGRGTDSYHNKAEMVIVGHLFFRKKTTEELIKTTLGRVFLNDEKWQKIKDELAAGGETVKDTRKVQISTFFMRKFDGEGWIGEAQETVFSSIPLVPIYGNYQVIENKTLYRGVTRKLKDPQRVLNYSQSREIEEGALAPRAKTWMTKAQSSGHSKTLGTMNTNMDPIQFYNVDKDTAQPPFTIGGAQINPGLRTITESMRNLMGSTAGIFAAGMGDNPGLQSGIAIERLQNKSNNITVNYFSSIEVGVCRTATIINEAYPKVYDAERQQRILNIDGSDEMKVINQTVIDSQTGDPVILNDMSIGKYTSTCKAGPSFSSQQSETVESILKVAAVDPSILQIGQDIFLSNINAPGLDKVAERSRQQLLKSGVIPENQMTEEEKAAAAQAAQQPKEVTADMVLAQAEQAKADAQAAKVQVDLQKVQLENQKAQNNIALEIEKLNLARQKLQLEAQQKDIEFSEKIAKLDQATQKQEFDQLMALREQQRALFNDAVDNLNTQSNTMKTIAEAIATSPVQGPGNVVSYIGQTQEVIEAQNQT